MIGGSWTHLLARELVRPLLGTGVTPNHLTTLRLLSGLAACGCFALGSSAGMVWGGVIWLVSALLDRADGELARIGNMMSEAGHRYDYYTDILVNTAFFVAIGVGVVFFGLYLLLVRKISERRNWARIVYLVLVLIGLPFVILSDIAELKGSLLSGSVNVILLILQLAGTALLFTSSSNRWFRSRS